MLKLVLFIPLILIIFYCINYTNYSSAFCDLDSEREISLTHYIYSELIKLKDGYQIKEIFRNDCSLKGRKIKFGEGWQKIAFSYENDSNVIVKSPNLYGPTHVSCLHKTKQSFCNLLIAHNMIEEIRWMTRLRHDSNVIKLISYCIPSDFTDNPINMEIRTERGIPLTTLFLVQQSWQFRYELIKEIVNFVHRYPQLSFNDFRRQQFVLVDNKPKLVDLDGIGFGNTNLNGSIIASRIYREFIKNFLLLDIPDTYKNVSVDLQSPKLTLEQLKNLLAFE